MEVPSWAMPEAEAEAGSEEETWWLECIKNGVVVGSHGLGGKGRWVVGRAAESVDIALFHESISRVHAILQRSREGKLYVADVSQHGTRLNKNKCPRGGYVELKDGDVMSFGGSTRLFVVRRPSSAVRERAEAVFGKLDDRRRVRATREEAPATWSEPPELPDYLLLLPEEEEVASSLRAEERRDKDAKLLEKIDAKVRKANNVRKEIRRLEAKDDLSDAQRRALDRNEASVARLLEEIADIEAMVRSTGRRPKRQRVDDDDDDDEMRDLTEKLAPAKTVEARLERRRRRFESTASRRSRDENDQTTAAPLPQTYDRLVADRADVDAQLATARRVAEALAIPARDGDDVLDHFLADNEGRRRDELARAAARDAARLEARRRDLDRLIALSKPALEGLGARTSVAIEETDRESLPVLGEESAPNNTTSVVDAVSFLRDAPRETDTKYRDKKHRRDRKHPDAPLLEGGDLDWVPPAGQDGSGRTKLNDLLGY
ncbi:hypothetical protein CTAYLR_004666 [Chrysophaeum taylorii]|uniref:FHA domain-containing protein n=1 Tax=Chrysophaeum taylorii TaxID=2483200 RepID=A0AAD7U853_9STRA|nr:hypothetical protein CTAYLR_004666 [Chrysophaeum taylorii]